MIDVDFELRNQDNVSSAGGPRRIGNPSGVAAHHFDDDHAVVRIGRGVNAIDSLGGNRYCGVKAECHIGAADVIVDGLGDAHAGHAVFAQKQCDRLRIVAAEGDQRINLVELQNLLHLFNAARNLLHVGAGRMKNSATL